MTLLLFCLWECLVCRLKLLRGYHIAVRLFVYLYITKNKIGGDYNVSDAYFSVTGQEIKISESGHRH
jgi:hypothetical protein